MRNEVSSGLVKCANDPRFVFLTGDLGFNALEPLQEAAGPRFINAGVAEQNMISVAAGMAHTGLRPWAYSIAPFVYARPFEQIRNDVCLHDLPVKLVGNGGGYGYGVMGGTHHALEDYGAMLCLRHMRVFVPAFGEDVEPIIAKLAEFDHPAYLRLGRDEKPNDLQVPPYAPWRHLLEGDGPTMVVCGPLVGTYISPFMALPEEKRPDLWVVTELPITMESLPDALLESVRRSRHLFVIEEHVAQGSVGQALALTLAEMGRSPALITHCCAQGYLTGRYGSQNFHRKECGLDPDSIVEMLNRYYRPVQVPVQQVPVEAGNYAPHRRGVEV